MARPVWLEIEARCELEASGTESRHHRQRVAEVRIATGAPVAVIDAAIGKLRHCVLHVVQIGLLEIGVVENVERFREELQTVAFADPKSPRQIEVDVVYARSAETIEFLARHHGEIDFRIVKNRGVWPAAGKIQDGSKFKTLHVALRRCPDPRRDKSLRLVELRRPTLRSLIELIEVTGPLIGHVRVGVRQRAKKLLSIVA